MTHRAILCLGSNTPDAAARLDKAVSALRADVCFIRVSAPYMTDDDTGVGAPYLNMVAECRTGLSAEMLDMHIRAIEHDCGRRPDSKPTGIMPLDIDCVIWDGTVVRPYDYGRPYFRHGYEMLCAPTSTE